MSELKVNKISPRSGTDVTLGDSGDTITIASGATLTNSGNLSVDGGTIKLDGNYPVGTNNVALGDGALDDGSLTGGCNVAIGTSALTANTSGFENIAVGAFALGANTSGCHNVAVGSCALTTNTTGCFNIGVGRCTLTLNCTGANNTAIGAFSLEDNTTGNENHAIGRGALASNTTGGCNIAIGRETLGLSTGSKNTAVGHNAGNCITTGSCNTILGPFIGNACGLDISNNSCNVILSDGRGQPYIVSRTNGTRFITDTYSQYSPSINSAVTIFTNLSTSNQTINKPTLVGGNTFVYTIFLQNIDNDQATFSLSMGREDAVSLRLTAYGAANCSISETSEGVFAVTGLGDGRTYTFTFDTGFATFSLKSSSLATGSTIVSILGIGAL
jgi:hypothetical protein